MLCDLLHCTDDMLLLCDLLHCTDDMQLLCDLLHCTDDMLCDLLLALMTCYCYVTFYIALMHATAM